MEFVSELNDANIKQSCRTCLTLNAEEMISIFDKIDQVENDENVNTYICDMLMDVALIELDRKEILPTLICSNCLRLVQLLFNFRRQCNRSQAFLLEYLTEKENNNVSGTLGTKKKPNQQEGNILNKKSTINKLIDIKESLNEATPEHIVVENDLQELSHSSNFNDTFNATVKLEFGDEINMSDTESETEKEDKIIGILGTRKSPNHDGNVLNKKSSIKESITNDVNELSNPSSSNDLLNSSIKLEFGDEIIKSDINSECNESLHSKIFTCQLCDKSFKTETLYFVHTKQHTEENFVCNVCNKSFKHRRTLTAHMKKHSEDKLLHCNVCSEKFVYRRALNAHMKQHPENKHEAHVCDICGKHFDHRKNLIAHLQTHKNEKRFSCKICGKKFKQSGSVTPHMRIHTGQKPFLCSVCGTGFSQGSTLKYHMRIHTKEKPYMCNVCGKTTSTSCQLIQHMRSHTGEKPYKCTECGKAYTSSAELKTHSVVHTGLKPYTCSVCKKSFNRRRTLRLHEKIHTDDKPHACLICGKKFIQAHSLRSHLQTHAK